MKNETKILVGAIIVILLLLVGAFALSGSSPQPSATPTVSPVTATPTPTPVPSVSVTPSVEPTVTATATATATPSVTPTPTPESGVKQTEFGYWITYPPLGPQNWSEFKPYPTEPAKNIVYFDPTSGTLSLNIEPESLDYYYYDYIETYVYREGDLNCTVNVTIHAETSDNIIVEPYLSSIAYDYVFSMHSGDYDDLAGPDENGDYVLTFGPGESEKELCLHIEYAGYNEAQVQEPVEGPGEMPEGQVTLTITKADGGYVPGPKYQYVLSLAYVTEVRFGTYDEQMYYGEIFAIEESIRVLPSYGIGYDGYIDHIVDNGSFVDVYVPVARQFDIGDLTVYFYWEDEMGDFAPGEILVAPYTFPDGEHNGLAKVSIPEQYVLDGTDNGLRIYFAEDDSYYPIYPDDFDIYINDYAV